jgi:hypothetical protein
MIIRFNKGKRNRYKFPIGIYISKIPIYPLKNGKVIKYHKKMRTINFKYKHNIYSIFINWKKQNG